MSKFRQIGSTDLVECPNCGHYQHERVKGEDGLRCLTCGKTHGDILGEKSIEITDKF